MNKGKQVRIIAVIMMVIALTFGYWTAVHAEETEEEQTIETTTQETQEDNGQTIDDSKQKLEEISTKIDKVDNQIASQKVDSEKIAEQAKDIEALKTDLEEVKATLQAIPTIPGDGNDYNIDSAYKAGTTIPLNKTKRYYVYLLSAPTILKGTLEGGSNNVGPYWWLMVSNSENINFVRTYDKNGVYAGLGITGLYNEGDKIQAACAIQVSFRGTQDYQPTEAQINAAKELLINPDNWGWPNEVRNGYDYNPCNMKNSNERISDKMLVPVTHAQNTNNQTVPYSNGYTGIAYVATKTAEANESSMALDVNGFEKYLSAEIIEAVEPQHQDWTTEQLYMPVLVIMSILVIILFKKH